MECLQCGSTEFTKLSLIHEQGSSTLHAVSGGLGLTFGTGGADLVLGRARTRGEIQTKLSKRVSPPHKWSYWKTIVGGLIGLMVLEFALGYAHAVLGYGGNFRQQLDWLCWSYLGLLVFALGLVVWYNWRGFPRRYRAWRHSFMCQRCGYIMQVERPAQSQLQSIREARS